MSVFRGDIEKLTMENTLYRKVIHTVGKVGKGGKVGECGQQLVLMSLEEGEDIPKETHHHTTQFIRVESGKGVAVIGGKRKRLADGVAIVIPPGKSHYIANTGKESLKLYSIYSPPEHSRNRVDRRQKR